MEVYIYHPHGVCSREMKIYHENGIIKDIEIIGGCNGNLKGICALVRGMELSKVQDKLQGIRCGLKNTSCPDQLSHAISEILAHK